MLSLVVDFQRNEWDLLISNWYIVVAEDLFNKTSENHPSKRQVLKHVRSFNSLSSRRDEKEFDVCDKTIVGASLP